MLTFCILGMKLWALHYYLVFYVVNVLCCMLFSLPFFLTVPGNPFALLFLSLPSFYSSVKLFLLLFLLLSVLTSYSSLLFYLIYSHSSSGLGLLSVVLYIVSLL